LDGGRAKNWPLGWASQAAELPSCGISYGTSVCPTFPLLGRWDSTNGIKEGSSLRHDCGRPRASDVIDVLPDRSAASIAAWLAERPSIELIARDRDGLYADASRQGAPQAKQIANRFPPGAELASCH